MRPAAHLYAYIASICLPLAGVFIVLLAIPHSLRHSDILSIAKMFWFTGFLFALANGFGLIFGTPWHRERIRAAEWRGWEPHCKLIVAYVSRGDNAEALLRAITQSQEVLNALGVQYELEAITDTPVYVGSAHNIVVPADYQPPKGAKYKARALHYASQVRAADRNTWVLHMDEESVITPEVIHGITRFLTSIRTPLVIGQGEIKYNAHNYGSNFLLTAVDAVRTGDDLGRFRLQYKLFGRPLFGMHGSFFIVNSLVERKMGFDLGGKGSITEDAYFALMCADRGVKFQWVEGFIREQSPFTLKDLIKQRRRWITGLRLLVWDKRISRQQRALLAVSITLSHISWLALVVTVWNILAGGSYFPVLLTYAATVMTGVMCSMYMVGAYRNITDIDLPLYKQAAIWLGSWLLVPFSCGVEGAAVLYSIVKPVRVFEVVDKN